MDSSTERTIGEGQAARISHHLPGILFPDSSLSLKFHGIMVLEDLILKDLDYKRQKESLKCMDGQTTRSVVI